MLRIADVRNQRISAESRKRMLVFIDEPFHLAAQFRSDRVRRRNQQPRAERLGERGGIRHALCERCNGVHTTMLARARLGVVRAWGWRARGILRAVEARASPRMVYALSTPLIGCWVIETVEPIETCISLIDGGFRGSPGAISLIDGGSRRRNEPRGHLFAPLTLVFCKGAAIYKRDTNCHPAKSATHKRDVFSWVWHEASPYFDTPVALYGYDYANRDYTSRDYTN